MNPLRKLLKYFALDVPQPISKIAPYDTIRVKMWTAEQYRKQGNRYMEDNALADLMRVIQEYRKEPKR